jgi:hypothetical protein
MCLMKRAIGFGVADARLGPAAIAAAVRRTQFNRDRVIAADSLLA